VSQLHSLPRTSFVAPALASAASARPVEIAPQTKAPVTAQLPTAASRKTVGSVPSTEQLPTIAVVGKYPSARSSSPASQLLDRGFAMDQAKQPGKALEQYAKAGVALRRELGAALGDKLTATGLSPAQLQALPAHAEPMIVGHLVRSGLFADLPAALRETTLKYFNRAGLAQKHAGDAGLAAVYCSQALELSPKYGPAHYNMACATTQMEDANGPTDVKARIEEALHHLASALASDKPFFTQLALSDPDWNTLRSDARFRALVGLPALPAAASAKPTEAVLATYPSARPAATRGAAKLIDEGWALDQKRDSKGAIAAYETAFPALRDELAHALSARLEGQGVNAHARLEGDSKTAFMVALSGKDALFEALDPAHQDTVLNFFNRLALAHKHEGNLYEAAMYTAWATELRPNHAPSLYNFAAVTLLDVDPKASPVWNQKTREVALEHLGRAIQSDPAFFAQLAKKDPDFNALRDDARFKALIAG
jgi:tetratricopeptide (TPR) repeat protein